MIPFVTNELLHKSFEIFGQVERAVIVVDDRGKPTDEGFVVFTHKSDAITAIRYCTEKCFLLTSSLRPCVCELLKHSDYNDQDNDGFPEKMINKQNKYFMNARSCGPRFAELASFEHEYGTRWKRLHEKHEALKNKMKMEEEKLKAKMKMEVKIFETETNYARYEHKINREF